ncbi:type II secretion system F family protein [Actinomyces wuliandei]|uniref:type II secretion system F family protein n=1 Tax=Actinomyces wuliandei TaxID=2057743 RepID=UPI001FAA89A2|nr:type II secretion system F family protein [Actinomyces wuliandei]
MVAVVAGLVGALLVLGAAQGIRMVREDGAAYLRDDLAVQAEETQRESAFVRLIDALGVRGQRTLRRVYGPVRLRALDRRLRGAGNPEGLHLDLFIQREAGFILLSMVLFLFCALMGQLLMGVVMAAVFSGWMYLWLAQAVRTRRRAVDRDLPDFLDVLAVTVRSGTPFRNALERVCDHFEGPVSEEMRTALHEMRLGVSRRDAFTAVRQRCRSESVDTFVTALLQSEELGTPIGEALQGIVKEIRRERAEQVRREAARTAPQVSLIASATMLPGTMILMLGGMLYANRDMLSGLLGG